MVNNFKLSRRSALAGMIATLTLPTASWALSADTAENLVRQAAADITKVINSGQSESAMLGDFEQIFKTYADVPTIARFSLGAAARGASQSELRAYTDAFSGYISHKYGRRFRDFIGGAIEVTGSRSQKNLVVVDAVAKLRGESPIGVNFQVSDRSGRPALFNVVIEGVNMLTTERTEIGAMLDREGGSIAGLTARLKKV